MKRNNIENINRVNCCEGCSCKICFKSLSYPFYVLSITLFFPMILYLTVVPSIWLDNIYWLGFFFIFFTNIIIVLEALFNILSTMYIYYRKKRHYIWNTQSKKYQLMYETDYNNIARANYGILICPKDIKEAEEKKIHEDKEMVADIELADQVVGSQTRNESCINVANPSMSIIIPAYLVNEQDIILDTIRHIKTINYYKDTYIQVILVYNSPPFNGQADLLKNLNAFKADYGKELLIVEVSESRSKAQNINFILDMMEKGDIKKTEFVAIYDADHMPEQNSLIRAVYLMDKKGADVLQGRCIVYNNKSFLGSIVAVEFDMLYIIHHKGGELVRGMGFFGGSNGIWRYNAINQVRMDHTMLTEDIDSSMRAIIDHGLRFIYSNSVVSYELCPTTLLSLIKQRIRWSQGWFQVTLRHTCSLLASEHITLRNKVAFFIMLLYREIFYYPASQVIPLFIMSVINNSYEQNQYLLISTILSFCILPLEVLTVNLNKKLDSEYNSPGEYKDTNLFQQFLFVILAPLYDYLKFFIVVSSHILELCGNKVWRITSRT